jgi:hypothetical protein
MTRQKVKIQTVLKKVHATARKSQRREAFLGTPQRLRDAAQRRDWIFCGSVKFYEDLYRLKVHS